MPIGFAMAQLSRPFQIGLAAVAVLAAAWLLLVHGHNRNESPSAPAVAQVSSTPTHTVTAAAAPAKKSTGSAGSATGHGSASSLGSLGHAVEKARGAVATSKRNEASLAQHSSQASSETSSTAAGAPKASAPATSTPTATTPAPSATKTPATAAKPSPAASTPAKSKSATPGSTHSAATSRQRTVEAQLAQGKLAVILFWDPTGSDDRLVHSALRSLRGDSGLKIAIDEASPSQVASFGTITRGVQVYGTPTLLFVNSKGQALVRTGFQDAYTIAQAVREARHPVKA
jgi:hypothetical protein